LLTVFDSYYSMWGCKGCFFASQNGVGWCPFNFESSPPIQSAKITTIEVSQLHVIFDFNGVLVVKWVATFHMQMPTSFSLTLRLGLKDFLTICFVLFKVYIWYASWHYNIDKYLDERTNTYYLDPSRVLKQKSCQKNDHFLVVDPKKPILRKNLKVFFSRFLNTHDRNTLFVDDMLDMIL
jgi:hypothetical protein